ncbi:hypothetical protein CYCD_11370 [Tenuifilaceae bacterium CYCD]|nr:hypothetical protein CYCD_11370 [Tenuifilaceae bacterium CYCD]
MQPNYKWVKTYIGYNTMSFSQYSLNGHQFLGGGVELTPPDLGIKFSAMYGRLIKGVEYDSSKLYSVPYYERMGFATKLGYSGDIGNIDLSIFKAWDKNNSIGLIPDSLGVSPKENMVFTINLSKTFYKKIKISGEYAGNALTNDTRQTNNKSVTKKGLFFLITPNGTTSYSRALKSSIDYLGNSYTVGVAYERVDPNYSTLGSYYTNNDLENISLTFSKQLNEGKINVSGNIGKQRNNLDKSKISTSENFLGNLNFSYAPGTRITLNTSYSNFSYYTYMKSTFDNINSTTPYQNIDTLNFSQISQTATLNSSIILGSLDNKDYRHILSVNFTYQQAANKQEGNGTLSNSSYYQSGLIYSYSAAPINLSLTSTALGSYSKVSATEEVLMIGPVIGASKSFFSKKVTTNTSIAYNSTYNNRKFSGEVFSIRVGGSYSHQKVHKINISLCFMHKTTKTEVTTKIFECTGNISYTYSISKQ